MFNKSSNIQSIEHNLKRLNRLMEKLKEVHQVEERVKILDDQESVKNFLEKNEEFKNVIKTLDNEENFILKSLLVLDQGPIIFKNIESLSDAAPLIKHLLKNLHSVEKFYDCLGGIIGYHATMLKLILEKDNSEACENNINENIHYMKPPEYQIEEENSFVRKAVKKTLENMPYLAEIYPVGGAGDRLNLKDEANDEALPAAELLFGGRTLLEGLIRDLQAREYLYYKLFEKQVISPIAMMTSEEKNNEKHILSICERHQWFGRPKDSYAFFKQPLVPVLTEEGNWVTKEPLKLLFKPGGHGVIWKLALDAGIIDRLLEKNYSKALVRQINNPIAGTDYGLLALPGCGLLYDQLLGFASCPRLLNTAEGMNVLIERKTNDEYEYCISNIEYPDFVKKHIKEIPEKLGSPFSAFPANTNIIFVDLKAIKEAISHFPVPGMLINMKLKVPSANGMQKEMFAGRLESLMQNIADVMIKRFKTKQSQLKSEDLHTFLTYNVRRKTISVTKKLYTNGSPIIETPEGCYYDQLLNYHELFTKFCLMKLPEMPSEEEYIQRGPNFITAFHPALGPLFSTIAQKIQSGSLSQRSEMVLEIAEVEFKNVDINGSLLIFAENIVGHKEKNGCITYSENVGRCILKNVKVLNKGICLQQTQPYWKGQLLREEMMKINLQGKSEFVAENVIFKGAYNIEVPNGYRMIAYQSNGSVQFDLKPLSEPEWQWKYYFNEEDKILIKKHAY